MRFVTSGIVAGLAAVLAAPVFAKDELPGEVAKHEGAVVLEPSSPWNIDYGESRCRLARVFTSGEERFALFFEQGSPSEQFSVTFGGPEVDRMTRPGDIFIGMKRDKPMTKYDAFGRAELPDFGPAIIFQTTLVEDDPSEDENAGKSSKRKSDERKQGQLLHVDLEEAGRIDQIVLRRGKRILSVETGNMKAPFEALNQCAKSLLTIWGLDADQHDLFTPVQWQNKMSVIRRIQDRYPSKALRRGEQGIFRMRIIVEADGTMSECHINNATLTNSLASPACQEMRRARFEPALDANGEPMRSYFMTRIIYMTS